MKQKMTALIAGERRYLKSIVPNEQAVVGGSMQYPDGKTGHPISWPQATEKPSFVNKIP
jgi:hypothetical protein